MVPPSSSRISRVPPYFSNACTSQLFMYGAITRYGGTFQNLPLKYIKITITGLIRVRSPLLGKSRLISFPAVTEMFQFSAFASHDLCIQSWIIRSLVLGLPIQISSDQCLLPAPRGFSQAATSFFASYCQGIHHVRLIS